MPLGSVKGLLSHPLRQSRAGPGAGALAGDIRAPLGAAACLRLLSCLLPSASTAAHRTRRHACFPCIPESPNLQWCFANLSLWVCSRCLDA